MAEDTDPRLHTERRESEVLAVKPSRADAMLDMGESKRKRLIKSGVLEVVFLDGMQRITMRSIKRAAGAGD
jgi:hypothetical protein